ncbi:MAG: hypothetical protein AAB604_00700 [Patescibacteria group bacterium]
MEVKIFSDSAGLLPQNKVFVLSVHLNGAQDVQKREVRIERIKQFVENFVALCRSAHMIATNRAEI